MKKTRNRFPEMITGYVDGELSNDKSRELEAEFDKNPDLKNEYVAESRLKKIIKSKAAVSGAPNGLRQRIERAVAREQADPPTFLTLLFSLFEYRPVVMSAALAFLILLMFLPSTLGLFQRIPHEAGVSTVRFSPGVVKMQGRIICLDCDVFANHKSTSLNHSQIHTPAVVTDSGEIWTIVVDNKAGKEIKADVDLLQREAIVEGRTFGSAQYIEVDRYTLL